MDNLSAMNNSLDAITEARARRYPLAAAHHHVMKDVLDGLSSREIAIKYSVTPDSVAKWKKLHKDDIAAAKGRFIDVASAASLASRENRIHELDALYWVVRERLEERMERDVIRMGDDKVSDLTREMRGILHDIEASMGQQLPRATDQATTTTVNVIITRDGESKMARWDKPFEKVEKGEKKAIENVVDAEVVAAEEEESDGEDQISA